MRCKNLTFFPEKIQTSHELHTSDKRGRLRYFSPSVEKYYGKKGLKNEKEEVIYVNKCTLTAKLML
jgi:hypothetical protein